MTKILLVKDQPDSRYVIPIQIDWMGFTVTAAKNGKEGETELDHEKFYVARDAPALSVRMSSLSSGRNFGLPFAWSLNNETRSPYTLLPLLLIRF